MKTFTKSVLAAALAVMAACTDDPVQIEEDVRGKEAGVFEPALARQGEEANADPFRARLDVEFTTDELVSDKPITVWLEGIATEKIDDGIVQVSLPTIAGMDLAGEGKPIVYSTDRKVPVAAQWTVGSMEPGDMWKASLEIDKLEKGYYQIAVNAAMNGPGESPYVYDDAYVEGWMLVVNDGGRITDVFDESVFTDPTTAVQPGPFKVRRKYQPVASADHVGGAVSAGGEIANSSNDQFAVKVVYEKTYRKYVPAPGAVVSVTYWEQGDDDWGRTESQTVPASGYVYFDCPEDAFEYIEGKVYAPTTDEVNGGHTLYQYFEVLHDGCGDETRTLGAWRYLYIPWKHLNETIPDIEDHFEYYRSRVNFTFTGYSDTTKYSKYNRKKDVIEFRRYYDNKWTAAHEFTHALHNEKWGGTWNAPNCSPHYIHLPSSYSCALKEGIADYGADIATNVSRESGSPRYSPPSGRAAGEIEGNVAALLLDLIDPNNEGDDETDYTAYNVITAFRTCRAPSSQGQETPDFVWCLEGDVDEDVHEDHFPGIDAPSSVSATRPSSWDAEDIRSTWIQNVGDGS